MLTRERVLELLRYEPESGKLFWLVDRGPKARAGAEAGCLSVQGYWIIRVERRLYRAHHLVWLIETGEWPSAMLDHVDRNTIDNRFANLRLATSSQNNANRKAQDNNQIGLKGVTQVNARYRAVLWVKGRRLHLGYFDTAEAAHAAYGTAAHKNYGEFARAA